MVKRRSHFKVRKDGSKGTLKASQLKKNKYGKTVSKKKSELGRKNPWARAVKAARKALKIKGFMPIKKGSALYKKAKQLYKK